MDTHIREEAYAVKDKTFYFWTVGKRTNPAVLIIPGFTGTHVDLLSITRYLRNKYFIIIPDMPGWGKSPKMDKPATIENYADYLEGLLTFYNISSLIVIGHCMGTAIAIEFAFLYPRFVKKLILLSTPYDRGTLPRKYMRFLMKLSRRAPKSIRPVFFLWRARIISSVLTMYILKVKSFKKKLRMVGYMWRVQPHQDEEVVETNWNSLMHFNFAKIRKINKPIHLIHGEKDILVGLTNAKKFSSLVPHGTFDIVKGGGHNLHFEKPQQLEKLIFRYL